MIRIAHFACGLLGIINYSAYREIAIRNIVIATGFFTSLAMMLAIAFLLSKELDPLWAILYYGFACLLLGIGIYLMGVGLGHFQADWVKDLVADLFGYSK